eukprot:TRINITY_DN2486_c0_g2_i1.p1 TRINITY_DN2486_c0_g2~~TRINITY_DN2486_c0_g2_i1.p1  ORF type:complete len:601 (+),score=45.45 TRINITY_DN2486_c0_g2_i1:1002-2804(+)
MPRYFTLGDSNHQKFAELGYNENFTKLGTLTGAEISELINGLNVFPGHRAKLLSAFSVIKQMFPEEFGITAKGNKSNLVKQKKESVKRMRTKENIEKKETRSSPPVETQPETLIKPALGLGYFLGEKAVPSEVEDLVIKCQNYVEHTKAPQKKEIEEKKIILHKHAATFSGPAQFCINDADLLSKCLAHAVLKHIEFSDNKRNAIDLEPDHAYSPIKEFEGDIKEMAADTFSAVVNPDLLKSFLTIEEEEEEDIMDLSYTQSHLEDFVKTCIAPLYQQNCLDKTSFGKEVDTNLLVQNYKNTLSSFGFSKSKCGGTILNRTDMQRYFQGDGLLRTCISPFHTRLLSENPVDLPAEKTNETPSLSKFDSDFDFSTGKLVPSNPPVPTLAEVQLFCQNLINNLPAESPVISLLYLEKLMLSTGILMNSHNWQRLLFISLVLAAKVWSDDELSNTFFVKKFPSLTLEGINELERIFLQSLEYKLHINGAEYAKYHLVLRAFAGKENMDLVFNPVPLHKLAVIKEKCEETKIEFNKTKQNNISNYFRYQFNIDGLKYLTQQNTMFVMMVPQPHTINTHCDRMAFGITISDIQYTKAYCHSILGA